LHKNNADELRKVNFIVYYEAAMNHEYALGGVDRLAGRDNIGYANKLMKKIMAKQIHQKLYGLCYFSLQKIKTF
jgi:hypothetical protein